MSIRALLFRLVPAVLAFAAGIGAAAAQSAPIEGTWRTLAGTEITIAPCGPNFCGTLSWIVIPREQTGLCQSMEKADFASLILDYKNPDRALQTRPLLGAQILKARPTREANAYTASIYNAEDGSTNDVLFWVVNNNTLRLGGGCVMGYCVVTQDWPRVDPRDPTPDFTCS